MKISGYVRLSCKEASVEKQLRTIMVWKARTERDSRSERAKTAAMRPCPSCGTPNGHRKIKCRGCGKLLRAAIGATSK